MDEKIKKAIYNPELMTEIYLDRQAETITGKIAFIYGDLTINPFSSQKDLQDSNRILLRDIKKEGYVLRILEESEFKVQDGMVFMEDEEKIFDSYIISFLGFKNIVIYIIQRISKA